MKKKILSGVLAFAMLFGSAAALPEGVFSESTSITASAEVSKATSGKVGEKVNWVLKNGVVTISGTGNMFPYTTGGMSPFSGRTDIKSAIIKDGVTNIGNALFDYCKNLTSITIPNSVKFVGYNTFEECRSLKSIVFPDSIDTIPESVCLHCRSLEDVAIPNSVKTIERLAFFSGTKLKSMIIPKSVTKIDEDALGYYFDSDYNRIKISGFKIYCYKGSAGEKYAKKNGFAYEYLSTDYDFTQLADGTVEITKYNGKAASVTIPSAIGGKKVSSIGSYAFSECDSITSITLPKGVKKICAMAFYSCKNLSRVTIPSTVVEFAGNVINGLPCPFISGEDSIEERFTIYCDKGSKAEKYAKNYRYKYRYINSLPSTNRLAGANRYETASIISTKMYPKTSDTVIIATGMTYHDAMVAVPLASAYNAPLLLATEKHITAQTEAELKRLKAKNVIVVSTNGAIGAKAKAELKALNLKATYIEGNTCFETAAKVAKALQTKTKKAPDTIFFATDSAFADALSASPVAAIKNAPIIYLKNTGSIDKTVADYLKSVKGKVKNAYIIGGDGVISDAMISSVAKTLGLTSGKTVQRVAGANRYETCVAVNNKFKSVLTGDGICVAKGLDFPDALAGGVYAASTKQALFLADGKKLLDCQNTYLKGKNAAKITVFGGTGAVSDSLVKLISKASV